MCVRASMCVYACVYTYANALITHKCTHTPCVSDISAALFSHSAPGAHSPAQKNQIQNLFVFSHLVLSYGLCLKTAERPTH